MALLGGANALGAMIGRLAPSMSPRKITQTGPPPEMAGFTPAFEEVGFGTPTKVTDFTPAGQQGVLDPLGMPAKFNPADLFAPAAVSQVPQNMDPATMPQFGGQIASLGGDWSGVDQWNSAIQQAAAKYGVPANLIKAVMRLESNGANLAPNSSGAQGPMQVVGRFWSGLGYNLNDPAQNIMAGAAILKQMYDTMGNWEGATRAYFAGPGGAYSGNTDSFGTNPTQYWNVVNGYWQQLNGASGTAGTGFNPGGATKLNLGSMFKSTTISQEFNNHTGPPLYGYGTAYGMDGVGHTGLDVSMVPGTPYYAPAAGTVTCAGTGRGAGADGGGCGFFQDTDTGGVGRVELRLDNGTVLIFGHSQRSAFQPGQKVQAGQLLGWSGGMNGGHVHLEARVPDSSMPSGYRIVDPRTVVGGSIPGMAPTGSNPYAQQSSGSYGGSFRQSIRAFNQRTLR